jgi:hypothetical protein
MAKKLPILEVGDKIVQVFLAITYKNRPSRIEQE